MELAVRRWNSSASDHATPERLLFLHGMGGTGTMWRPVAASLEEDFDILSPDQRGHGESRIPANPESRESPSYAPLDYGQDLVETLEAHRFHPVWAIGHSMGVRSACALAHLRPEWVRGLILVDLGFSGAAGGGLGDDLASFLSILPMEFDSRAEARDFMEAKSPDPSIGQYLLAVSVPRTGGAKGITFPFDKAALIETIHAARDSTIRDWIREAAVRGTPVLALRGGNSLVWSESEFRQEERNLKLFPSVRFEVVEGTGHGLPFEKRQLFVDRIRQFVRENS